jgi:hypothetical protein
MTTAPRHLLWTRLLPTSQAWQPVRARLPVVCPFVRSGVVLLLVVVLAASAHARVDADRNPCLTLVLSNEAQLPLDAINQLIVAAGRIFGAAGVDIQWRMQALPPAWRGGCKSESSTMIIHAVILPGTIHQDSHGEQWLGRAFPSHGDGASSVVLLHDSIAQVADFYRMAHSTLLALALAHEAGHLFLPPPAHDTGGIMSMPWDRRSMDKAVRSELIFTNEQGKLIRQYLMNRACPSTSTC